MKNTCERGTESISTLSGAGTAGAGGEVSSPTVIGSSTTSPGATGGAGIVTGVGGDESPAPLPLADSDTGGESPDVGSAVPDAAVGAPPLLAIAGHVIDRFRRPVAGVAVTVGETTLETDEAGAFAFDGVPSPYDVALLLEPSNEKPEAWVYQGLTRADPTLQVLSAFAERSSGFLSVASNIELTVTQKLGLGAAGPDGSLATTTTLSTLWTSFEWRGSARATAVFHGLLWENSATGLPLGYLAHDSKPMTFQENFAAELALDLSPDELVHASVSGTVTGGAVEYRQKHAYVYFADQSQIELLLQAEEASAFEFLVPSLPGASIIVAASDLHGVVHQQVAPGTQNIELTIPLPARPLTPGTGALGVGPGSVFEWEGDAAVYVLHIQDSTVTGRTLRVITSGNKVVLPALSNFSLNPGSQYYWEVQTHGSPRNVDDLAGPEGSIDPFYYPVRGKGGPRRLEGSASSSEVRWFISR